MLNPITCHIDGKTHHGTYRCRRWHVDVSCAYGSCSATIGLAKPEIVAQKVMKALIVRASSKDKALHTTPDEQHATTPP